MRGKSSAAGPPAWRSLALTLVLLGVAATAAVLMIRPQPCGDPGPHIEGAGAELHQGAEGYSVLVTSDTDFHVGALMWMLRIGDSQFHRSDYPEQRLTTIEFPMPSEALSRLRDGDSVAVHYGSPASTQLVGDGSYSVVSNDGDEASVDSLRGDAFGTLRIPGECAPLGVASPTAPSTERARLASGG